MSLADPCSLVRIAIALAALKHKPNDQSIASYLLDLHSRFPLSAKENNDPGWRTYALELEKQLATLKAQRDADQELLSKHHADASQVAATPDGPPPKKRSKKNAAKDHHDFEWSWDQSRTEWSRVLSSQFPCSPSLITAYAALKGTLASPNADLVSYATCLSDAILRALDTTHVFLFAAPNPTLDSHVQTTLGTPTQLKPEHIDSVRIALASPLLVYVLRVALHNLVRTAQDSVKSKCPRQRQQTVSTILAPTDAHTLVDKVLDRLLERTLLPLLRALVPLCSARLAPFLSVPPRTAKNKTSLSACKSKDKDKNTDNHASSSVVDPPKTTDVRTDIVALIGTSLEALDALSALSSPTLGLGTIASDVRSRLGLDTIRQLEILYAFSPPLSIPADTQRSPVTPGEPTPAPTPAPAPARPPSSSTPSSTDAPSQSHSQSSRGSRVTWLEKRVGTRAERVKVLATRDAGWFLATMLNMCVAPAPVGSGIRVGRAGLLREALLDRIGKLVRAVPTGSACVDSDPGQQDPTSDMNVVISNGPDANKFAIDTVCRNMLLAICERAMTQLTPS